MSKRRRSEFTPTSSPFLSRDLVTGAEPSPANWAIWETRTMDSMEAPSPPFQSPSRSRFHFFSIFAWVFKGFISYLLTKSPKIPTFYFSLAVNNCISTSPWIVPNSKWYVYFTIFLLILIKTEILNRKVWNFGCGHRRL